MRLRAADSNAAVKDFVLGLDLNPVIFLLLTQLIIVLLGLPLEWSEIVITFVPISLAPLPHFGVDPLFFGILVALNLQTSFLILPMPMSAYYLKDVAPRSVQLTTIFKGCLPFVGMVFIAMAPICIVPGLVNRLPEVLYRR
jgi:TRAP-type mannitol/chloroaromatic compound transport system permease large subunit